MRAPISNRITTNEIHATRDDRALEAAYALFRYKVEKENRRAALELIKDAAGRPAAIGVCQDGEGNVYALAKKGAGRDDLSVDTVEGLAVPVRIGWDEIDDAMAARLLLNSCTGLAFGNPSEPNDTGRYFAVLEQDGEQAIAVELSFDRRPPGFALVPRTRTFTRVDVLEAAAEGTAGELGKIERQPRYRLSPMGTMAAARPSDVEFALRKPKGSRSRSLAKYASLAVGDEAAVAGSKLGVAARALNTFRGRFGDAFRLNWMTYEATMKREIPKSDFFKEEVASRLAARSVVVNASECENAKLRGEMAEAATALAAGISEDFGPYGVSVDSMRPAEAGEWEIRVVPNNPTEGDGYGEPSPCSLQHIALKNARRALMPKSRAIIGSLLKELLVKQDAADGRISAFDWESFGIESADFWKCYSLPKLDPEDEQKRSALGRVRVDAAGSLLFESCEMPDLTAPDDAFLIQSLLCSENGTPLDGAMALSLEKGGERCFMTIKDSGLICIPNDFDEFIRRQVAGESPRSSKAGMLNESLAPLLGVTAFERDGDLHYCVGNAANLNTSLPRGVAIRRVHVVDGEDLSKDAVELSQVGLARYGRPSAVPIFSKYVDEHMRTAFFPAEMEKRATAKTKLKEKKKKENEGSAK